MKKPIRFLLFAALICGSFGIFAQSTQTGPGVAGHSAGGGGVPIRYLGWDASGPSNAIPLSIEHRGTNNINFFTGPTQRMTILGTASGATAGFVGINIVNPLSRFHVFENTGEIGFRLSNPTTGIGFNDGFTFNITDVTNDFRFTQLENANTDIWNFDPTSATILRRYRLQSNGQMFIGTPAVPHNNGPAIAGFSQAPTSLLNVRGPINSCEDNGAFSLPTTILYGYTTVTGNPTDPALDGYRLKYDWSTRALNDDYLIFEKTDGQSVDPDGGILFENTGNDGVEQTSLRINGLGRTYFGQTDINPQINRVTIESMPGDATPSGLRFFNLPGVATSLVPNPGPGILSVDALGNVIYVDASTGIGNYCTATPNPLTGDYQIPMNDFNYHFSDNGSTAAFNNVGIGTNCGALIARLQVQNPVMTSGISVNTTSVFPQNFGVRGNAQNATFKSNGVAGYAVNLGPVFNTGVYGEASNAIQSNYGGEFKAYGPSSTNNGVIANATSGVNANYGVLANANGGLAAFGIYGQASGGLTNYAVYGYSLPGSGSGSPTGPNYAGYFDGDVYISGSFGPSDINLKENIDSVENALALINQLKPKTFTYKNTAYPSMNLPDGLQYGLIAQDVETVLPELVSENTHPALYDSTGVEIAAAVNFKGLEYQQLIPLLLKGIQEQQRTISDLTTRLTNLENCISNLNLCDGAHTATQQQTSNTVNSQDVALKDLQAVILDQNVPNPFAEQTTITYTLTENIQRAQLLFYNAAGKLIQSVELANKAGKGEVNVFGNDLSNGIYTYTLVVDGKIIDTKRMVKNK